MNRLDKIITALTALWYRSLIDHHKDRDCHFKICKVWSYGDKPLYRIEHDGYINEFYEGDFDTYESAARALIEELFRRVESEVNYWTKPDAGDEYHRPSLEEVEHMKGIGENLLELKTTYAYL